MARYLSLAEVVDLHQRVVVQGGGASGLRDLSVLESAVAQPRAAYDGQALYPDLCAKAAALGHALVANHPFVGGNTRHASSSRPEAPASRIVAGTASLLALRCLASEPPRASQRDASREANHE